MFHLKSKLNYPAKLLLWATFLLITSVLPAMAQGNFQSGSTGTDGAFNPTSNQTIPVPESGVFNFTTVTIPSGITVTFTPNSKNTPVTLLATSDIVISGTISVAGKTATNNGNAGQGGPGGFAGGNGGYGVTDLFPGINGSGPGGGRGGNSFNGNNITLGGGGAYATNGQVIVNSIQGSVYGSGLLQPLIGGSGGGGGGAGVNSFGGGGGGGGGAILIASSTSITLNSSGQINANGGNGGGAFSAGSGGGSGGAIRLVANTLFGTGTLSVTGGGGGFGANQTPGGTGGLGYIRAEGFNTTGFIPVTPGTIVSLGAPNPVAVTNAPDLKIVSVAGLSTPSSTSGSLSSPPDIVIPSSQSNPVTVVLEGRNLPANTVANLTVIPTTGVSNTTTSGVFTSTGTPGVTSASGQINLPVGMSVISALAVIDLSLAKLEPMFIDGEKVERIEITAVFGKESQTSYITSSGKKITR